MVRWFFVVPAALIGFGIAQLVVILVTSFAPAVMSQLIGSFVTPIGFILLGARVAPTRKLPVAVVLAALMILFYGFFLGLIFKGVVLGLTQENDWISWASIPLGFVGSFVGIYVVYRQSQHNFCPQLN